MDTERIKLAVWEVLINNTKADPTFVPTRDIPAAIVAAIEEYEWQRENLMEIELTKEAKGAIAAIYSAYEARRKAGESKSSAVYFSDVTDEGREICRKVKDSAKELKAAGLIGSDVLGGITLKDSGIIFMENKTANTVKEWLSFLAQFIP